MVSIAAPVPTKIAHFTHLDNLASIVADGLSADTSVNGSGQLACEAGEPAIKERRRRVAVGVGRGGRVSDYVPFYFAPKSPMLYSITMGNVRTFDRDPGDLVYLCSSVEALESAGVGVVISDRNAATSYARFSADRAEWTSEGYVDWELMSSTWWNNTIQFPERRERRMAECLAHKHVPWSAILELGVVDEVRLQKVEAIVGVGPGVPPVHVRPEWYY